MLNISKSGDGPDRKGIQIQDRDCLEMFQEDVDVGPKLHCTYLDTSGRTTEELMESDWNQMFMLVLAKECEEIAKTSRDPNRFAAVDWLECARERVYRILLEVARAVPQPGETQRQALIRLMARHNTIIERARNTESRHAVSPNESYEPSMLINRHRNLTCD